MNKAARLQLNDKVAIVSLSGGMLGEAFCSHDIQLGRKRLKEFGLEMVIMPNALKGIAYLKEHPEARAADLKTAFLDDSIKGIICAIGGDDTYRTIPFLLNDEEFVQAVQRHSKIFTGFSDSTVNHLMFYKLGLVSYYGPNLINDLAELANDMLPYTKEAFEKYLGLHLEKTIRSSNIWYEERTDFSPASIGTNRISHEEQHGFELIHGCGSFGGELLGGCLDTIYDLLTGVDHKEACEVSRKYELIPDEEKWKGKILFIETSENCMLPETLRKALKALDAHGVFRAVNGIIVGKPQNEVFYSEYKAIYQEALSQYPDLKVLYNVNFGHGYPRTVIPYGIYAYVNPEAKEIRFSEPVVG